MTLSRWTVLITMLCALGAGQLNATPEQIAQHILETGNDPDRMVMAIKRLSDGQAWTNDVVRADVRFQPASTSKIPHTLIALETGYAGLDTSFTWDGTTHWSDGWNQDQTLETAFRRSVVWVYQQIAMAHGHKVMAQWLHDFGYGNADIGGPENLTEYWLRGPLAISANEQIAFLERLATQRLPLSADTYTAAWSIMQEEAGEDWVMYAKTGYNLRDGRDDLGWYVGWIEAQDDTYLFALNMDIVEWQDAPQRQRVARAVLVGMGILPPA